ncbi:MAG TPA: glycogen synthase [Chloroflexota bacterium]
MIQRDPENASEGPPLKILFVATEMAPLVKVGGLGDVVGVLPRALRRLGHDARVILPRYSDLNGEFGESRSIPSEDSARVLATESGETPVYLIEDEVHFGQGSVYGHPDDVGRFLAFSHAALAAVDVLEWTPDVIHCHDWHTAIIPFWVGRGVGSARVGSAATVLTIHNLAYQGWFDPADYPPDWVPRDALYLLPGRGFNVLSQGLVHADLITTVSAGYAHEITTVEFGEGLDHLIRNRSDRLRGIPNGIDSSDLDPSTDPLLLPNHYSADSLSGKLACKLTLQQEFGFGAAPRTPLLGMVGRLVDQKGFDLALDVLEDVLPELTLQVVLLGNGEPELEARCQALAAHYPRQFAAFIGYDEPLAHRIYAGADLMLVPSRFEPGGLVQLMAQRYGAVPVVRRTGGLADTVFEDDGPSGGQTGFLFDSPQPIALAIALGRVLEAYRDHERWRAIQQRGMQQDFSWDSSSVRYVEAYRDAIRFRAAQS